MNHKILHKLFVLFVTAVVILTLSASCSFNENKKGYHVDQEVRDEIWKLTSDACVLIIKNEFDDFIDMFSDSTIFDNDTIGSEEFLYTVQDILLKKFQILV